MSSPLSSKSPWLTLGGIVLLQSVSVASSLYPAYSSILGKKFSISQVQVVDLIAAVETGKLFECFPTAAADHLPPWAILLIGLLLGTVGHGVQYLYVAEKIQPSYWQMLLLCFLAGHSVCWIQTYCYFSALTNFNKNKNIAVLTSCYASLGREVYASLIQGIQGKIEFQNPSTYLLLTCIAPACVGLVVVLIVGRSILAEHTETDVFPIAFALAVAAGVYAMLGNTVQPIKNMSSQLQVITLTLVIILPIAVPLVKAAHWLAMVRWRAKITPELPCVVATENSDSIVRVDGLNEEAGEDDKEEEKVDEGMENVGNVELGDEHGVKYLLMSLNFWLFYLVNACGPMLGVVYVNNLTRISGSYEVPSLIAVFAASGFCGRIFSVSIEEYTRYEHFPYCFRVGNNPIDNLKHPNLSNLL